MKELRAAFIDGKIWEAEIMFLKPAKLGEKEIPEKILSEDRKHCKKIGPCGIGKEALYLNSFYLERRYYVPVSSVSRVF